MKSIKINWGAGIAAMYCGFVLMIIVLVTMSTRQKIDLVTDHYYDEELVFQDKISKKQRAAALAEPLTWAINEGNLNIHFPKTMHENAITGTIRLYCPADDRLDLSFPVATTNATQTIDTRKIPPARYMLYIDWKAGETTYWNEGVIRLNQP